MSADGRDSSSHPIEGFLCHINELHTVSLQRHSDVAWYRTSHLLE